MISLFLWTDWRSPTKQFWLISRSSNNSLHKTGLYFMFENLHFTSKPLIVGTPKNCYTEKILLNTLKIGFIFLIRLKLSGKDFYNLLIDWLGFNAMFNNFSVISRRPVHLLMCFLVFSHQYRTPHNNLPKQLAAFPHRLTYFYKTEP